MNVNDLDVDRYREPDYEIHPLLYRRWSPRAMSGEAVTEAELEQLFEAARWAPSSYNGQPWRFLWARRGTEEWRRFFDLLVEFNQGWADGAGALLVVLSRRTFEESGKPAPTHSFDAGAAWQNLALQGRHMGLVVHGMGGFDRERARHALAVPDEYAIEAMIAVGRPGEVGTLPEGLRDREEPSPRKPIAELAREGAFPS